MQNESKSDFAGDKKSWLWSDCKLVLRRTNPNNITQESYQNLQAEVELQSEDIQQPFSPNISFKKSFRFDPSKGFTWNKGVSLPPCVIKLQNSYYELLKEDQQIIMVYCQISVAYPSRKDEHFYLEEIKTSGQKKKKFSNTGQVQFDGIIVKQTSHQKRNSKFSLLITICASSIEENKIILKTLISTTFLVDGLRIKRKIRQKDEYVMKLVSPHTFLRPICQLNFLQKGFDKQKLILYLKTCNSYSKALSQMHPLYVIYHFSDIFKVYFNSRQVKNLTQLLQVVAPQNQASSKYYHAHNALVSYQLKKTKKIKKSSQKFINQKQFKQKVLIKAKIKEGQQFQKKLLMITFQNDILQIIQNTIEDQKKNNQQSIFQQQLQIELKKLSEILSKWTKVYLKLNFLRNLPWCICWRSIQRQRVFQAYKKHYFSIKRRLFNQQLNYIQNKKAISTQ